MNFLFWQLFRMCASGTKLLKDLPVYLCGQMQTTGSPSELLQLEEPYFCL